MGSMLCKSKIKHVNAIPSHAILFGHILGLSMRNIKGVFGLHFQIWEKTKHDIFYVL